MTLSNDLNQLFKVQTTAESTFFLIHGGFFFLLQLDTVFPPFNFPSHEEPSNEMFDIKGKFTNS